MSESTGTVVGCAVDLPKWRCPTIFCVLPWPSLLIWISPVHFREKLADNYYALPEVGAVESCALANDSVHDVRLHRSLCVRHIHGDLFRLDLPFYQDLSKNP